MTDTVVDAHISDADTVVNIGWSNGVTSRFHAIWLRDNSFDTSTRNPGNGQRLITIGDIDPSTKIQQLEIHEDGLGVAVKFTPDNVRSDFSSLWLLDNRYDKLVSKADHKDGWISYRHETWTSSSMQDRIPRASWLELQSSRQVLRQWLLAVDRFGFAVVDGVPLHSGAICEVAKIFGFVRETNYGKWFDVNAEVTPQNLANTNLGLQAHTDNPYRDPVPTLQLLGCLENSVLGGESAVVDGFAVAKFLQESDGNAFDVLSHHPVRFLYEGTDDVSLSAKRPIFELGPDGELLAVRFNNRSAAPFIDIEFDGMEEFYEAYRKFAMCLDDPSFSVRFKLEQGQAFIVDNTRVLHARTAFDGSGKRWLQGCYADKDGLRSTLQVLERELINDQVI
ncbi:MAG: gamma-butyrobetaine dioxygenase [Ilumatobacteraceae bacterium]